MNAVFTNRRDAGKQLAQQLTAYTNNPDTIVLALPRGGVPVAYEVARKLNLPLDVCLVRKIGLPNSPETAMGAVAKDALFPNYSSHITMIDRDLTKSYGVKQSEIQAIAARQKAEIRWRETCYRHYLPMLAISDRTVIIVDDGMATGLTMQAAVRALSTHQPIEIIVAIPVASWQAISTREYQVDDLICLSTPRAMGAVSFWYEDFTQVSDREVCDLLSRKTVRKLVGG
ncbi:MAG: phosphoribosyltransferase family protein [Cyanobacteria bacterium P01_C01_bin.72]